jgi:hypothetical protein
MTEMDRKLRRKRIDLDRMSSTVAEVLKTLA